MKLHISQILYFFTFSLLLLWCYIIPIIYKNIINKKKKFKKKNYNIYYINIYNKIYY